MLIQAGGQGRQELTSKEGEAPSQACSATWAPWLPVPDPCDLFLEPVMTLGLNTLVPEGYGRPPMPRFIPTELGLRQEKAPSISVDLADSSPKILHQETQSLSLKGPLPRMERRVRWSLTTGACQWSGRHPGTPGQCFQETAGCLHYYLFPHPNSLDPPQPCQCPVMRSILGV